jgi:hypothetical protein
MAATLGYRAAIASADVFSGWKIQAAFLTEPSARVGCMADCVPGGVGIGSGAGCIWGGCGLWGSRACESGTGQFHGVNTGRVGTGWNLLWAICCGCGPEAAACGREQTRHTRGGGGQRCATGCVAQAPGIPETALQLSGDMAGWTTS